MSLLARFFDVFLGTLVRSMPLHSIQMPKYWPVVRPDTMYERKCSSYPAGFDAKVMLWDMRANTWEPIQTLKDATSSITSLSILGASLYASSLDGHVRTYDLRLGKMMDDLVGHAVNSVRPSKLGDSLLVSSQEGKLRLFDAANGSVLQTFTGQKEGRCRAIWGYGEESVVAGDEDGKVWAWDVLNAKLVEPAGWAHHKRAITALEMHPNGKEMVTASAGTFALSDSVCEAYETDGTVKVWSQ
jgi:mitogen-activated protein kinase organizer 1